MALIDLLSLPSNFLSSRGRYTPLGHNSTSFLEMVRANLTGSALRGAIAGTCGIAFLVSKALGAGLGASQQF